jgi:hypothetical protein
MSENELEIFYLHCIRNLLEGLDIQEIDRFMVRLTPENCRKLGLAYSVSAKEKIRVLQSKVRVDEDEN